MIPITRPYLGIEESEAASKVILNRWVSQGPKVQEFEELFAKSVGAKFAVAVANCTTALHLALLAAGVQPGDEVITASHSFIATANSIRYCGGVPVFVDIDPATFNIDSSKVEAVITPKTRAILCVHQMGMPCDLKELQAIAKKHDLALVEDAACAIGSEICWNGKWERIGRPHSDIACFSFHPRKIVTTGEGGMLTTSNEEIAKRFRLWRQHGMSVSDVKRHKSNVVIFEEYLTLGYNYRMTDIQASIGCEQLKRLEGFIARRRTLSQRYFELLANIEHIKLPMEPEWARSNWQSYCIRLGEDLNQKRIMQSLLEDGIATRRGIMCSHREPAYVGLEDEKAKNFEGVAQLKESEKAQDTTILIPIFHELKEEEQDYIARCIVRALERSRMG